MWIGYDKRVRRVFFFAAWMMIGCGRLPLDEKEIDPEFLQDFSAAPAVMTKDGKEPSESKVALGRKLYFDTRLSKDGKLSCNSCHPLDKFGVDGKSVSTGVQGQKGKRNAPSVFYAAGHTRQFWDGRAANVEEQAKGPLLNPIEMGMPDAGSVDKVLRTAPEYREMFGKAFPADKEPVNFDNAANAIAMFERQLVAPSRWDKYLAGDKSALKENEKRGFVVFYRTGCRICHNGPYVGGRSLQKLGLIRPWTKGNDMGRYEVTKQESFKYYFKVPSLRNVEKTGPYFHDGSVATLEDAVRLMAEHQIEKPLTDREVAQICDWLKCLTGEPKGAEITP